MNDANHQLEILNKTATLLKTNVEALPIQVEKIISESKEMKKEIEKLHRIEEKADAQKLLMGVEEIGKVKFVVGNAKAKDMDELRNIADTVCSNLECGIVVLSAVNDGKVNLVAKADQAAVKLGVHAGNIIKAAAKEVGGGGAGRPDMAQAGGKNPDDLPKAYKKAEEILRGQIK